ncbi:universal stress protein [Microbacterium fluvii]|uniref:Universal stress protein n=1 Tax=Microbacterium fluvii TaxID=415215 RepID=A0ABW2HA55_9MICO|nr:universal stress protein [Microbacterium fluvii]MCU4670972.1 universal stress protein [Microbacterium fluvii]
MVHIVVGYDGSPAADSALAWVADRATRGRTSVEVVTVTNMLLSDYTHTEETLEKGTRELRQLAPEVDVESHWTDGSMPDTLIREAERADLLVVGITNTRPMHTALRGWIPTRTAARATVPTVLVPEGWVPNGQAVMVGVDVDESADAAIRLAAHEASWADVPLRLVHAWQMPAPAIDGAVALVSSPLEVKNVHRRILDDAGRLVTAEFPELGVEEVLVNDHPAAALRARADRASMIVLGTHHRGLWVGTMLGSVAQEILFKVHCPVCIVPGEKS